MPTRLLITPHFFADEFDLPESRGRAHGCVGAPYPAAWVEGRLRPLCEALEVLRAQWDRPITVLSGYRTPEYNAAIGGARDSQHVHGTAGDLRVQGVPPLAVYRRALALYRGGRRLPIGGLGIYDWGVHVDIRPGQLVTWDRRRTASSSTPVP